MRFRVTRAVAAALLATLAAGTPAQQQSQTATERKLKEVRQEMRKVSAERKVIGGDRVDAATALKEADQQVGASAKAVARTEQDIGVQEQSLATLQARKAGLEQRLGGQKAVLAKLVRQAYMTGSDAPLKVFLSQDRVAAGQRALTQYGYLQKDRNARIRAISADLKALAQTETAIRDKRTTLQKARATQQQQLAQLEQQRKQRATLVSQLDTQYQETLQREQALGRDAKALEGLLARLRAEVARAERARQIAAERARKAAAAEAARVAREQARIDREQARAEQAARSQGLPPPPKPKPVPRREVPPPSVANAPAVQVGGLGWPVSGSLLAGFGGARPDGGSSSGLLIAAPEGTPVRAVAAGRVVFAEWMNGYGLISIVDHGGGYMSLYAHNDALLKDVGASVQRGDALGTVGTSGGMSRPMLYFELRRNGSPVNPAAWLQNR